MRGRLMRRVAGGLMAMLWILAALPAQSGETPADLLHYRVQAAGEGGDFNRLLATPGFLRLDRGERDSGYILYDRRAEVIYSVNPEDRSILVIDPPPLPDAFAAQSPAIELLRVTPVEAPTVAGVKPQRWVLKAGERACREAFVLPGVMVRAVTAYGEYLRVLARQQAVAQALMPVEFQDACDSAIHVFAADSLLDKGLILKAWDGAGYLEELIDFRSDFPVGEDHFELPQDYRQVPMTTGG